MLKWFPVEFMLIFVGAYCKDFLTIAILDVKLFLFWSTIPFSAIKAITTLMEGHLKKGAVPNVIKTAWVGLIVALVLAGLAAIPIGLNESIFFKQLAFSSH